MSKSTVTHIALTGGPCAGKTTALAHIKDHFTQLGIRVLIIPEMATIYIATGINPKDFIPKYGSIPFQLALQNTALCLEDNLKSLAHKTNQPTLIVSDRGAMDNKAYCSPSEWEYILKVCNVTEATWRDARYQAVIHLITAADGAEKYYTLENNAARSETPEQARQQDLRTQEAWVGHPHFRIVDNNGTFESKIRRTLAIISNVLGIPEPLEEEKKYVVQGPIQIPSDIHIIESEIKQTYLLNLNEAERVRSRAYPGTTTYTHTRKLVPPAGLSQSARIEIENLISAKEYESFLERKDPAAIPITKTRMCFVWNKRHYELDCYHGVHEGKFVLEAEIDNPNEIVELPPFLTISKEVTNDPAWSNHALSRVTATP